VQDCKALLAQLEMQAQQVPQDCKVQLVLQERMVQQEQ
jgi:hypothetical protein